MWMILTLTLLATTAPCQTAEHRQFDFWIGEWNVTTPDGKAGGVNRITSIAGGCALLEEWTGASGFNGKSLNIYDATRKVWHQTWVDSSGSLLVIEGSFANGVMTMGNGSNRITWTPAGGGLRQVWEQSKDGGKTWAVVFDGRYSKR